MDDDADFEERQALVAGTSRATVNARFVAIFTTALLVVAAGTAVVGMLTNTVESHYTATDTTTLASALTESFVNSSTFITKVAEIVTTHVNTTRLRGPSGKDGREGADGRQGVDGRPGDDGPTGPTGPTGPDGATGATGADGAAGAVGQKGDKGAPGADGAAGAAGTAGPTGQKGDKGAPGADGAAGAAGAAGPTGQKGDKGAPGSTGAAGAAGAQGAQGAQGIQGPTGATGPTGSQGAAGTPGGPTGPAGPTGATGPSYSSGLFNTYTSKDYNRFAPGYCIIRNNFYSQYSRACLYNSTATGLPSWQLFSAFGATSTDGNYCYDSVRYVGSTPTGFYASLSLAFTLSTDSSGCGNNPDRGYPTNTGFALTIGSCTSPPNPCERYGSAQMQFGSFLFRDDSGASNSGVLLALRGTAQPGECLTFQACSLSFADVYTSNLLIEWR